MLDSRGLQQSLPRVLRDGHVQASAKGQGRVYGVPVEDGREAGQGPGLERLDAGPPAGKQEGKDIILMITTMIETSKMSRRR